MVEKKKINYIRILALCLWVMGAAKVLIVGYDMDEQYALAMSYRMTQGDFLVYNMWEPHQTSGFLMALFMLPYLMITGGTTGIALYVRICGLICHTLIHGLLYKTLRTYLHKDHSLLVCGISFFALPKLMFLPEFANMQIWFLLLTCVCLLKYYGTESVKESRGNIWFLIMAGFFTALEVLTYPSTIFVFATVLIFIVIFRCKKTLLKELVAYILPCVVSAGVFLGILLSKIPVSDLKFLLGQVMSDGSHSTTAGEWIVRHGLSTLKILGFFAVYAVVAWIVYFIIKKIRKNADIALLWPKLWIATALVGQMIIWLFGSDYPNFPSVEYMMVLVLLLPAMLGKKMNKSPVLAFLVAVPFMAFPGVLLFSNHPLMASLPFLGPCVAGILALPEMGVLFTREIQKNTHKALSIKAVLFLWLIVIIFGKGYMMRTSQGSHYTMLDEISLCRQGVAMGLVADTVGAERNRDVNNLIKEVLPEGAKVFYIGKCPDVYLQNDMEVCTPSTISTPTYDDNVYVYFDLYPDKEPDYVIIDSGFIYLPEGEWARNYLEEYYAKTPIAENFYIKIYARK